MEGEDTHNDESKVNFVDLKGKDGKITRVWDYADDKDENGNEPNTLESVGADVGDKGTAYLQQPGPGDKEKMNNNEGYRMQFTGPLTYEKEMTKKSETNNVSYPLRTISDPKLEEEEFKRSEIDTRVFQVAAGYGAATTLLKIKNMGANVLYSSALGWSYENVEVQVRKVVYSWDEIKIYGKQKINWLTGNLVAQKYYGSEITTANKYQISYIDTRWYDTKLKITIANMREMNPLNKSVTLPVKVCTCDIGNF